MLQNQHAKTQNAQNSFSGLDLLFAILAHIVVLGIIAISVWWQNNHSPEVPLKRLTVSMISAQDLHKLQHKTHKSHPKKVKKTKKVKKLHKPKVNIQNKKKPVFKLKEPKKTAKIRKNIKKVAKKSNIEPDFDPFAPIESSSNQAHKTATKPKPDMADMMGKQLSIQEIDRYIAMMQAAVQSHWKVPGGISKTTPDPLVEMILQRNGRLLSVRILESSGNSTLDQTLIAAIRAAAPFHIPSQQFESFRNNRIRFHPL